jgi:hypothetical protein
VGINREAALLLGIVRNEGTGSLKGLLEDLNAEDWRMVLEASNMHGTTPLLYQILHPFFGEIDIPSETRQVLHRMYYVSAGRNMKLYHQLTGLIRELNRQGIQVILLKGAHLAEFVGGNLALRPMVDVDLLARKQDIPEIRSVLIKAGYSDGDGFLASPDIHVPVFLKKGSVPIEIHFSIVDRPYAERFDVEDLWKRAQPGSIQGVEVLVLSPEDLLLHLCAHTGVHHGFSNGVMPLVDIQRLIEFYSTALNWQRVVETASQWGLARCVYLMLTLAKKLIGASVPDRTLVDLAPSPADFDAVALAEEVLFEGGVGMAPGMARTFGDGNWSDKSRNLLRLVFTSREIMALANPGSKNSLSLLMLYLSRLKRLWEIHAGTAWSLLVKRGEGPAGLAVEHDRNKLRDWLAQNE